MERFLNEQVYKFGEKCKITHHLSGFLCKAFCPIHTKCSNRVKDCITQKYYVSKDEIFYK